MVRKSLAVPGRCLFADPAHFIHTPALIGDFLLFFFIILLNFRFTVRIRRAHLSSVLAAICIVLVENRSMWQNLLVVSAWGGVVALDTTAAMQILISHPLVSCSVVGLLLGNFPMGLFIGLIFELLYLDDLPVGGALFSEGNLGATVAAAVGILLDEATGRPAMATSFALISGVLVGILGGQLVVWMRRLNGRIYMKLIAKEHIHPGQVSRYHLSCLLLMFVAGTLLTLIATAFFTWIFTLLAGHVPIRYDHSLGSVLHAFLGAGVGVLIYLFFDQKKWHYLAIGLGLGAAFWLAGSAW